MRMEELSRRGFIRDSIGLAAPLMLVGSAAPLSSSTAPGNPNRALRVVCVGAHPDDPESGCAGTLCRYAESGHRVTVIYLTRGERGIRGKTLDESAKVRSSECESACRILGAKPIFFGQIDGATEVNRKQTEAMTQLLSTEAPDLVLAHWPIDTHMDHQVASFLTMQACLALRRPVHLYFFEVNTGDQSRGFAPNTYVDVTPVLEKKKAALLAHVSQDGQHIWQQHHEVIASWRGREAGVKAAEAFVHLDRDSPYSQLPSV